MSSPDSSASAKVLFVVDDEPLLLELIQALLECDGYEVRTFGDPSTALDAFRKAPSTPSMLLTDFAMQPLNGLELLAECRKIRPDLKSILLSGQVRSSDFAAYPTQPDRFFKKPFVPQEFLDGVRQLAER